jgi:hypothetical protein
MLAEVNVESSLVDAKAVVTEATDASKVSVPLAPAVPVSQEVQPTDPPPPPPAEEPTVVHRQSQEQLAILEEMTLVLEGLADVDDGFRALMADHGLTPERLAAADGLNRAAYVAVAGRRQADAAVMAGAAAQRNAYRQCRTAIVAFRQVLRTVIRDDAGRIALALDEPLPDALMGFAAVSAEALEAARLESYATLLGMVSYDAGRIANLQALLDDFTSLAARHRAAQKAASRATAVRDAAVLEVRVALRQIKVEVYALLRRFPHLSVPTGF